MIQLYDWYKVVKADTPLEQGDVILDAPVIEPDLNEYNIEKKSENQTSSAKVRESRFDLIVMTQSCDFPKLKDEDSVIFCTIYSYPELLKTTNNKDNLNWDKLRKGHQISMHLLNECNIDGYKFPHQIVDLKYVVSMPFAFAKKVANANGDRVRLLPPYREHLAAAFARQFMRVGLPIDIITEDPYKTKK